jgi:hypothetical protein
MGGLFISQPQARLQWPIRICERLFRPVPARDRFGSCLCSAGSLQGFAAFPCDSGVLYMSLCLTPITRSDFTLL